MKNSAIRKTLNFLGLLYPQRKWRAVLTKLSTIKYNSQYLSNESTVVTVNKPSFSPKIKITDYPDQTSESSVQISGNVSDKSDDDIKLFADYIMDLDVDKHDFYFIYEYQLVRMKFLRIIKSNFSKIKGRFKEIENLENKSVNGELDEKGRRNLEIKERYMRQFIVDLYVQSIVAKPYFCDSDYKILIFQ